jgi:hypothetical protein
VVYGFLSFSLPHFSVLGSHQMGCQYSNSCLSSCLFGNPKQNQQVPIRESSRTPQKCSMVLGKMPLSKKAHEKSLTSIEQCLMAGPHCQAGWGKDGTALSLGKQ